MFLDAYRFELVPRNQNMGFQTLAFKARREPGKVKSPASMPGLHRPHRPTRQWPSDSLGVFLSVSPSPTLGA